MSKSHWVSAVAILLIAALLVMCVPALAQSYDPDDEIRAPTGFEKRLTKLGRGLSNILLGWAEIPKTFDTKLKEGKPLGYLLGVVPVLGTTRALMRTGTGVFEIFTFPVSDKEVNFGPILEPEYILLANSMDWKRQGPALVGSLALLSGEWGKIVLVAPRSNARGAMVVLPQSGTSAVSTTPLSEYIDRIDPCDLTEVLCIQEREFGTAGLPGPEIPSV